MKAGAVKEIAAHQFERQAEDHYVEEIWCDDALFTAELFRGTIHDPCAGFGRIPQAARRAGMLATGSDIVDRGFQGVVIEDFLQTVTTRENIVMNAPFGNRQDQMLRCFIEHAICVTTGKVATIAPARRIVAAHWLRPLYLKHIWYLTPRPSMPPGFMALELAAKGEDPAGGKEDFCWLVFQKYYTGPITTGWLHRDRGAI